MLANADGGNDPPKLESQDSGAAQAESPKSTTPSEAWIVSGYHFLILLATVFGTFRLETMCGMEHREVMKQVYALIFGGLGGTVAASRWVVLSVRHNAYDRKRLLWQLLTPLYSAVLAWVGVIA